MKILHVLDHSIPLHDGYSFRTRSILKMQEQLDLTTCSVTSIKQGQTDLSKEDVDGLSFYRTTPQESLLDKLPLINHLATIAPLKQRIEEAVLIEKPDIIQAHSPALNGIAAFQVAKKYNIPFVYEIRAFWEDAAVDNGSCEEGDLRYKLTRMLENYVLKKADAVTTICQGLKDDIEQRKLTKCAVTIIPNAVNIKHFDVIKEKNGELLVSLNLEENKVIGFVGSFYDYEGLDILVTAMQKLVLQDSSYRLLLVGGGVQEAQLKQQVKELGIEKEVIFTGRVPHDQVSLYYSLIDILVYPRKSMRLTELVTPLKPLEAMAQGKLVLASDVGGHRELIEHGKTGCLFKSDCADSLVEEVNTLFEEKELQTALIANGREFVEQVRNWRESVSYYLPLYAKLLDKNG